MTEPSHRAVGGWVLVAGSEGPDIDALLDRFAQVYRYPIEEGERAEAMWPGQPCFLVRTDRSKVIGLWAVGEIVAPALSLPDGLPTLPGEEAMGLGSRNGERLYAEVELLPLAKPVSIAKLLADDDLAASELQQVVTPEALRPGTPLQLTPAQVRALEAIEFWIEAPSDEQRVLLDALLASEDQLLDGLD